jgi:hypothetical protein
MTVKWKPVSHGNPRQTASDISSIFMLLISDDQSLADCGDNLRLFLVN